MQMLAERLEERKRGGLFRQLSHGTGLIDLTSNDYFGFAREFRIGSSRLGSTGSRLLTGHFPEYE